MSVSYLILCCSLCSYLIIKCSFIVRLFILLPIRCTLQTLSILNNVIVYCYIYIVSSFLRIVINQVLLTYLTLIAFVLNGLSKGCLLKIKQNKLKIIDIYVISPNPQP